jgi:hypothetical protein
MASIKRPLGRSELVHLPELGWTDVEARIDTGAYHCAVHCINYHLDGSELVVRWPNGTTTRHTAYRRATVKSSFGDLQERYLVHLELRVYGEAVLQEFSLSDRSRMRHQLLLGRTFLKRGFVVDVRRRNVSAKYLSRLTPPAPSAP